MKKMKFTDCVDIVGSSCHKFDGTKVYVSTGAVNIDHIEPTDTEIVDYDGRPSRANLVAEENDILFAKMQATEKTLLIDDKLSEHIYSTGFCAVRAKDHIITNKCLYYLLTSETFLEQKDKNCSGATQKAITNAGLEKIVVFVPDLDQQTELARQMDAICNLIACRKEQLKKLDELVKSRFIEMFADESVSQNWSKTNIGSVALDARTGPFGSALHHDEFVDEGVFVLGIDNAVENRFSYNRMRYITEEKYQQLKRYTVKSGDVIITIMGTVGRSAVIPENMPKAINTKHLACITPDKNQIDPYFLTCLFQMHPDIRLQLQNQSKGAIMDGLNLTIIKALKFSLPPLPLQNQFVMFFKQTDKLKFDSIDCLKNLLKIYLYEV